jgi:hypothetical protein
LFSFGIDFRRGKAPYACIALVGIGIYLGEVDDFEATA